MRFIKTIAFLALAGFVAAPAHADENSTLCSMYSKTGGAMGEFMLPLTMQDFINMMTGKDNKLMDEMGAAMLDAWSGAEIMSVSKLDASDLELLSESAGQVAVELLMSGQATSKEEVQSVMNASCLKVTAKGIIRNQKRARAATNANMVQ